MSEDPDTPPEREYVRNPDGSVFYLPADDAETQARLWHAQWRILNAAARHEEAYGLHPDLLDNLKKGATGDAGDKDEWDEALADFFEALAAAQAEEEQGE